MLSDKALDTLVAATSFTYGMGDAQRRDGAREAVNVAAAELELEPLAPSLPRFAASEDILRAAALRDTGRRVAAYRGAHHPRALSEPPFPLDGRELRELERPTQ